MHKVTKSVLLPYAAEQMFALVDDVEAYPQFLPWCGGAKVLERDAYGTTARLDIAYHGLKAHFTTHNVTDRPERILITLRDGPFRHLHGEWRFRALAEDASKAEFELAYEFTTTLIEAIVGPVFNHIASSFIDAFVRRAEKLHAK